MTAAGGMMAPGEWCASEPRPKGLPGNEWHGVVEEDVGLAGAEHGNDVRMLELGGELDLAVEPVDAHAIRALGRENLHGHAAGERRLLGDEHARHATRELALQCVGRSQASLQ